MNKSHIYDLSTRIFHWLFVLLFFWSFFIARESDSKLIIYSTHMLSGLVILLIVLFRIFLGFFGSYYAKFASLPLKMSELFNYFKSLKNNHSGVVYGHNPASSWVLISVLCLSLIITSSGISMSLDIAPDWFEEIHAWSANVLFFISIFHIFGVFIHSFRNKDQLWLSIMNGNKVTNEKIAPQIMNREKSKLQGILFVFLVIVYAAFLYSNFNVDSRKLTILHYELNLGD